MKVVSVVDAFLAAPLSRSRYHAAVNVYLCIVYKQIGCATTLNLTVMSREAGKWCVMA